MKRDEILHLLAAHQQELTRFAVKSLAIFGSVARDEAWPDSDVDILVEFNKPVGLFEFVRLKDYLETLLDCPVDLVTPDALKEQLRERILKEAVHAG
jgi:predicted nucleotidyltransferase